MKKLLLMSVFVLQSCGVYECIDMQFERVSKPIDQAFVVSLEFQDTKISKIVQCEEYYDAMCAERGNFWAIREVGTESQYRGSAFEFSDRALGNIKIPLPKCSDMVKEKTISLKSLMPEIEGKTYHLESSAGRHKIYKALAPVGKPAIIQNIELSMAINNVPIR